MRQDKPWLSTEEVAQRVGMSAEWVRRQIIAGRLRATAFRTGKRPTYRISRVALREFLDIYGRDATDYDGS